MARKRKLPDGMVEREGRRGYYADFRIGGRRIQKKLGTNFEAAKSILNELKARAEKGEFGLLDNDYPIKDLRDTYLKRCEQELRPGTVERYRESLDRIIVWLDLSKVRQIDATRILDYREDRLQKAAPGTVNYEVIVFTAMLRWGVKQKKIGTNPLADIKRLPDDHKKEGRAMTDDEVDRLLEHSKEPWRSIWYALLVTGLRKMELANLRLGDIDWGAKELIVRSSNAKSRRERRIPIDDGLMVILQRQSAEAPHRQPGTLKNRRTAEWVRQRLTRDHVFVTTQNTPLTCKAGMYTAFLRCCRRARIETETYDAEGRVVEHVDVHGLRRTFATNAIVNGADPKSVQEILGHRTLDMTMRIYAKVKAASKRQAVAKLTYGQGAASPEHLLPLQAVSG